MADAVSATPVAHPRSRASVTWRLAARVGGAGWATGSRAVMVAVDIVCNLRRGTDTARTVFLVAAARRARFQAMSSAGRMVTGNGRVADQLCAPTTWATST